MNVSSPTCWQRFKACCCCNTKPKLRHYRSAARMEETIRDVAETSISKSIKVEVKHHHTLKSTDMVTASQFFRDDKDQTK